ncbi:hypothetical protein [Nissabacter sp. SGAir0207]|uniref:CMD domain-containing protein n=1 Tax=Nissabacter sp. SGAir0207 TaxID=2126321 RepID=UPI001F11239A|nr:hypothetical protein [Nissabacter sp. SGAir0207]
MSGRTPVPQGVTMGGHELDVIDRLLHLTPGDARWQLRRERPEFVEGANACRDSVLTPQDDQGISPALRQALALRMARLIGNAAQIENYQAGLADEYAPLAAGEGVAPEGSLLAAVVAHCDNVTLAPAQAQEADIRRLEQAGLNAGQIVALAELIAFVNFESRVVTGLQALENWHE